MLSRLMILLDKKSGFFWRAELIQTQLGRIPTNNKRTNDILCYYVIKKNVSYICSLFCSIAKEIKAYLHDDET